MGKRIFALALALLLVFVCAGCGATPQSVTDTLCNAEGESWFVGFGSAQFQPDENSDQPLYIAGYDPGREVTEIRDLCQARAVWLDTGAQTDGVLLIGVDCVALDSGTVAKIRQSLSDLPAASVNVYSTHSHAGADTLGMWGQIGIDGKNDAYMASLLAAAEQAARTAAADRKAGTLYYGYIKTEEMFRDSRQPIVTDENLYQLRFAPEAGGAGLRMFFYGAHAEALRGANTRLSRDFPGMLCDGVTEATGDHTMFLPGAIGGLVMTRDFRDDSAAGQNAEDNLRITAQKLIDYALSIDPRMETVVEPKMKLSRTEFCVPMDNTIFLAYKFLGILQNQAVEADSATGYGVWTELSILLLDEVGVTLVPGEIFPELVTGAAYGHANPEGENPKAFTSIAWKEGLKKLLIVGLSNDEIGYIVPPSDFLVNEELPYLERIEDYTGEDHYEETNSIGPECARAVTDAFAATVAELMQ